MVCQGCGLVAPTRRVELRQLVGLVVLRLPQTLQGELCRPCIDRYFWRYTGVTALAGWWGVVSFFLTPLYLVGNLRHFWGARALPRPAPDARPAQQVVQQTYPGLEPHLGELQARLDQGTGLDTAARELAAKLGLSWQDVLVTLKLVQARALIHPGK